jgi:Spy/CpxP family protein refolding chaperone
MVWKNILNKEPLIFPKNESYHDVSGILKEELLLSTEQVKKFDEIRKRYFEKETELKRQIKNAKDAMNEEMYSINTNDSKIIVLAREISENEYKIELLRFNQAKELKSVCTKDQQKKFELLIKEIRDYFRPDNQPIRK